MDEKTMNTTENNEQAHRTRERDRREGAGWRGTKRGFRVLFKIIGWCVAIVLIVFLTLFLSARIAGFSSIAAMIEFIRGHY